MSKKVDDARAAQLYRSGNSTKEIAATFGCGRSAVVRALHRLGIPLRETRIETPGPKRRKMEDQATPLAAIPRPDRRTCLNCGTRIDAHSQFGCKRWAAL